MHEAEAGAGAVDRRDERLRDAQGERVRPRILLGRPLDGFIVREQQRLQVLAALVTFQRHLVLVGEALVRFEPMIGGRVDPVVHPGEKRVEREIGIVDGGHVAFVADVGRDRHAGDVVFRLAVFGLDVIERGLRPGGIGDESAEHRPNLSCVSGAERVLEPEIDADELSRELLRRPQDRIGGRELRIRRGLVEKVIALHGG